MVALYFVFFINVIMGFGCPDFPLYCSDGEKIFIKTHWSWKNWRCILKDDISQVIENRKGISIFVLIIFILINVNPLYMVPECTPFYF